MASRAQVTLTFEVVDLTTGLWCRTCALSSGIILTLMTSHSKGTSLTSARRCAECGGDEVGAEG